MGKSVAQLLWNFRGLCGALYSLLKFGAIPSGSSGIIGDGSKQRRFDYCQILVITILHTITICYYNIAHYHNMNLLCSSGVDAGRALQLLTQPGPYVLPSLENVVSRATSNLVTRPEETPISDDQLNAILHVSTVALLLLHCDLIYRPHSGVLQFDDSWPCR